MPLLAHKLALITGASRGIGAAIAKRFATEGAQVILVGRQQEALEQVDDAIRAAGGASTLAPMDLLQFDMIDALAQSVAERFGKLDILVGNAAILGTLSPLPHACAEEFERVMATNVTANFRLIRAFDPLLRASEAGRALFVTSGAAQGTHPYWGAYAASKAALEIMVKNYAAEVAKTSVRVSLIDPGVVRTAMRASAFPGEDPNTLPAPEEITDRFIQAATAR